MYATPPKTTLKPPEIISFLCSLLYDVFLESGGKRFCTSDQSLMSSSRRLLQQQLHSRDQDEESRTLKLSEQIKVNDEATKKGRGLLRGE